jgi:hypothetical protein
MRGGGKVCLWRASSSRLRWQLRRMFRWAQTCASRRSRGLSVAGRRARRACSVSHSRDRSGGRAWPGAWGTCRRRRPRRRAREGAYPRAPRSRSAPGGRQRDAGHRSQCRGCAASSSSGSASVAPQRASAHRFCRRRSSWQGRQGTWRGRRCGRGTARHCRRSSPCKSRDGGERKREKFSDICAKHETTAPLHGAQ